MALGGERGQRRRRGPGTMGARRQKHADEAFCSLAPYLTLPYLLSLTWLATPILSLLFVAFRLNTSADSAQDAVGDTKANLLASCAAAEQAATVAASLPRYMAAGTNRQIIDTVNGTMDVTRKMLIFLLTIVETIIEFVVDTYRSTFLCFLELVVRGGLAIIIGAVQEISTAVTSSINAIRSSIQSEVAAANSVISSAVSAINKVTSIVNVNLNVPQSTIPSLTLLQNVTIPADFENSLLKLNSSLPTLSELRDVVNSIIETPFTTLKVDINNTFATFSFSESLLTVPAQRTMTFCQDMDTSIVDDLGRDIVKITKIGVGLLVLLTFLMILANCFVQWWQWRCMKVNLQRTRHAWASDPTVVHVPVGAGERPSLQMTDHNLMTLLTTQHHPLLTHWANVISKTFRLSLSQHNKPRWFCAYVFHMPALTCLLIGLFGVLSVQIQLAVIKPIQAHYSSQVASSIGSFTNSIADNINTSMQNQSAEYVNGINGHPIALQASINNHLFGWVNGTTTALNNTLVTVYADVQKVVNTTFGGTVLDAPAQEFVRCILGSKIEGLEKVLTFLNENLKVSVPTLSPDTLTLSNSSIAEITKPISAAAVGSGDAGGDSGGLVGRIVDRHVAALKEERLMFFTFLGLWGLVVLMALCILLWHSRRTRRLNRDRETAKAGGYIVVPAVFVGGQEAQAAASAASATEELRFLPRGEARR
ncbi:hypothetical protein BOTBODRAFT_57109 [Botryobasidium botryosum FD-172 SS1]|uniref:Plasma membrane fusion protein PRM1 n=1 Tax=Botryobasidium botryosum (strain FD-172 SS1) TaxID=930990 RepID=A0A067MJI7_BOTB1|nr:hypothetical protein BOTBODRAFT_57109 [Botryobasidium botryosum FD-172 SS1]